MSEKQDERSTYYLNSNGSLSVLMAGSDYEACKFAEEHNATCNPMWRIERVEGQDGVTIWPPKVVYKLRASTSRIIIHDSHTGPEIGQVEEVSRWHIEAGENAKRMGLMSIGYHFIIERDGHVVSCRDVDRIGTHAPGNNLDSIGVCLVGGRMADRTDVPEDNFTGAQRKALIKLIVELRQKFGDIAICGKTEVQRYKNRALPPSPYMDMDLLRDDVKVFEQMGVIL